MFKHPADKKVILQSNWVTWWRERWMDGWLRLSVLALCIDSGRSGHFGLSHSLSWTWLELLRPITHSAATEQQPCNIWPPATNYRWDQAANVVWSLNRGRIRTRRRARAAARRIILTTLTTSESWCGENKIKFGEISRFYFSSVTKQILLRQILHFSQISRSKPALQREQILNVMLRHSN